METRFISDAIRSLFGNLQALFIVIACATLVVGPFILFARELTGKRHN